MVICSSQLFVLSLHLFHLLFHLIYQGFLLFSYHFALFEAFRKLLQFISHLIYSLIRLLMRILLELLEELRILCSFLDQFSLGLLSLYLILFCLILNSLQLDLVLKDGAFQSVVLRLIDHEG